MSPCISICAIGVDGYCTGCRRTLAEISGWARMTADEQWAVVRALDERFRDSGANAPEDS